MIIRFGIAEFINVAYFFMNHQGWAGRCIVNTGIAELCTGRAATWDIFQMEKEQWIFGVIYICNDKSSIIGGVSEYELAKVSYGE